MVSVSVKKIILDNICIGRILLLYFTFCYVQCQFDYASVKENMRRFMSNRLLGSSKRSYNPLTGISAFKDECYLSNEASKNKLMHTLERIKKSYYEVNRHMASTNIDYDEKEVKQMFSPYIPTWHNIKRNADTSKEHLKDLKDLNINYKKLKPREERLIYQFRYFLESNFDNIYNSYYDGVWMLGPDYFCEQPICFTTNYLIAALKRIHIRAPKDLELIIFWIKEHRKTFETYKENIKKGVEAGMVQSKEVCKSSAKTFAKLYRSVKKSPEGAMKMSFAKYLDTSEPYKQLKPGSFVEFYEKHNKTTFKTKLKEAIIKDFGEPLHDLLKYLKEEHVNYCPPSSVSSGLGGLPLTKQYYQEKEKNSEVKPVLPSGEKIDVTMGYKKFMNYYTTSNISGSAATDLGYKLVEEYYKQILTIARNVTQIDNNDDKMIEQFKIIIRKQNQFYNEKPFPEKESGDEGNENCDDEDEAQKNCPERWASLTKWFNRIKDIMQEAKPAIKDLFYESGPKKTTPECKVKLVPEFDPTNGVPSYLESDELCEEPASYFIPFFKNDMGPKYEDYNTNYHEARPGHHLQIQGFLENFKDECGGISEWINYVVDYYPAFSEGWGVYSENPLLLEDTNVLKPSDQLTKYGLLKWQVWRALRLVVDVGFHEKNMTREEAFDLFKKYTWDDSDTTLKELTRYQGTPGQATSYSVGQNTIISLRKRAKDALGDQFDIKDFHFQLLQQGQSPFDFVSSYIDSYIKCTKDSTINENCNDILRINEKKSDRSTIADEDKLDRQIAKLFRLFKKKKHT